MNRIRELREAARMSVDELAAAVGTSDTQIRRLEAGTRRLTQGWMERIALALEAIAERPVPERHAELLRELNAAESRAGSRRHQQGRIGHHRSAFAPRGRARIVWRVV